MTMDTVVQLQNRLSCTSTHYSLFLKAHLAASKADNPSWREATRGKFADEYWEAMKLKIATLENVDAWTIVE